MKHLKLVLSFCVVLAAGAQGQGIWFGYSHGYYGGWGFSPFVYDNYANYGYSYWPLYGNLPYYSNYAAIAYSPTTNLFSGSYTNNSARQALESAQAYCGEADCKPVVWVQAGCAATAQSASTNRFGWGYHAYLYQAKANAMRACRLGGPEKDCKPKLWVCSF